MSGLLSEIRLSLRSLGRSPGLALAAPPGVSGVAVLLAVAALASGLAARRATGIDPADALHEE